MGIGAQRARPPNIRASKSATTKGGRRRCISSPFSELKEQLGESTICRDLLDLKEVSASTTAALVPAAFAVSESDQKVFSREDDESISPQRKESHIRALVYHLNQLENDKTPSTLMFSAPSGPPNEVTFQEQPHHPAHTSACPQT
ncbi:hypothetical protein MRB53_025215 [Persea americana]|uniref:Uncharacterized protein n=1 Tax=Persea americana TaxID=3435 RepID=A0ACC2LEM2_PERAE|nr:hypothetical protein MRB53_025215 [Persea americana]